MIRVSFFNPTGFDAGDMNLFRYCGDDPIDGSDPLGLQNAQSNITPDRIWEMAKYMDATNMTQGTFQEQMLRRFPAGMDGADGSGSSGKSKSLSSDNEGKKRRRTPKENLKIANDWLAKRHKDLDPNGIKPNLVKLAPDRQGEYHPMKGIKLDPYKLKSPAAFVGAFAHELLHRKNGAIIWFLDRWTGNEAKRHENINPKVDKIREEFIRETGDRYSEPYYDH